MQCSLDQGPSFGSLLMLVGFWCVRFVAFGLEMILNGSNLVVLFVIAHKLSKRRIKFDLPSYNAAPTVPMRGCHPRRSSPPLRPFVCNSGSSFDRRLLHAYDWLCEQHCHPSPVGRRWISSSIRPSQHTSQQRCRHSRHVPHAYSSVISSCLYVYSRLRLLCS